MGKYERNPVGLDEADYKVSRAALIESLRDDPQRLATFLILEGLAMLEQGAGVPEGERHEMRWSHGTTTEEYIEDALAGFIDFLPVPSREFARYTNFQWRVNGSSDSQRNGPRDVRILNSGEYFDIRANLGRFAPLERELIGIIRDIPYPIYAWDDFGFQYENPAKRSIEQK